MLTVCQGGDSAMPQSRAESPVTVSVCPVSWDVTAHPLYFVLCRQNIHDTPLPFRKAVSHPHIQGSKTSCLKNALLWKVENVKKQLEEMQNDKDQLIKNLETPRADVDQTRLRGAPLHHGISYFGNSAENKSPHSETRICMESLLWMCPT